MATILIVEDQQNVRGLITATLIPEHRVVEAANVAQAVEMIHRIPPPDLLLLDLNLEGHHDGLEVCRILRSDPDPDLARTPVIMLTGETHQADIAAALAAGADGYVGKP
jgi:CheY-like chemotaxis protein